MFTEDKFTEIFFMAYEFCIVFNRMKAKYAILVVHLHQNIDFFHILQIYD